MRWPPNQSTPTLDTFTTSMTTGNISAMSLPTRNETSMRSALAASKRPRSCSSRTKARITRMPAICSRTTRFTVSMRTCMRRNSGRIRMTRTTTIPMSTGRMTTSRPDRGTSWRRAMMIPPTHMIGAVTMRVKASRTSIWTCWTSLVVRVMSEGAPKWPTSRVEKAWTRSKTAARTSRPSAMAVWAPK